MSGVNSFGRKVWDKEFYSKNKEEREQIRSLEDGKHEKKSVSKVCDPSEDPKKKREAYLNISKNIGLLKSYAAGNGGDIRESISGYWCESCKLAFNDSHSWIRHINSQSHNQKMGASLYVEKKSLESVKKRLSELIHDYDNGLGVFSQKSKEGDCRGLDDRLNEKDQVQKKRKEECNDVDHGSDADMDEETRSQLLQYDLPSRFL